MLAAAMASVRALTFACSTGAGRAEVAMVQAIKKRERFEISRGSKCLWAVQTEEAEEVAFWVRNGLD